MASFERNPGKPVRTTFYLLVKIEIPDRARSHRQQIEPLDIQSYLPPSTFRMVIFPMPDELRGRVMGIHTIGFSLPPLGGLWLGATSE